MLIGIEIDFSSCCGGLYLSSNVKEMETMFYSHVDFVVFGPDTFANGHDPPLTELKGYLYVDRSNRNLCLKVEGVYAELKPDLADFWAKAIASR